MKKEKQDFIQNETNEKRHHFNEYLLKINGVGILFIFIAATAFAFKGVFAKLAFGEGIQHFRLL